MVANTAQFDATGHMFLTINMGQLEGLPVGLMIIDKQFDETTVLQFAYRFEQLMAKKEQNNKLENKIRNNAKVFDDISSSTFLEGLENEDVRVVRHRLEEEKEKRLLIQNDVEVLMLKVAQLERASFDKDRSKCQETPAESTNTVAFHASYSKADVTLAIGQILIFDRVLANHGNGYSQVTGIFRASIPGAYLFTLHLLSFSSITLHNSIFKNDVQVSYTYAGNTGSQSVIIDLVIGDEVYVKAVVKGGAHGGNYCTFTGFMIHEILA